MKTGKLIKFVALLLVLVLSLSNTAVSIAQEDDNPDKDKSVRNGLEGKIYDADQKSVLKSGTVRIVHSETGESREDDVSDKGTFCFRDIPTGNYSLTYIRTGVEFPFPDKFAVAEKVVIAACLAMGPQTSLVLMADKDADECRCSKGVPFGWILLGGGAAIAAGVIIGGGEEPEASPSQP